jgi:chloramphenicol-sensitive protein RarD
VFHERQPSSRWFGFAIVWGALVLLVIDAIRSTRSEPVEVVQDAASVTTSA